MCRKPDDPAPEEIEQECRRIREGWTHAEHYRRAGLEPPVWAQEEHEEQRRGVRDRRDDR